jgi:hypothetical protein
MDQSSEQLKAHIRSMRNELDDNLQELEGKVSDLTNFRVQFQRHPMALLGAAFVGGLLVSAVLRPSRGARHVPQTIADREPIAPSRGERSFLATAWRDVKGTIGSAVGAQIYSVLRELITGRERSFGGGTIRRGGAAANKLQGEGDHEAARRYDKDVKHFVETADIDQAARDAAPRNPEEAAAMQAAEQAGRARAKLRKAK